MKQTAVVIGCGGIGYQLHEPLARMLSYSSVTELIFVDGKVVTPKNMLRQHHPESVGRNKADVLAENARKFAPENVEVTSIPMYISEDNKDYHGWLKAERLIVFAGVDNNRTRVMLEEMLERRKQLMFISGGNDLTKGQAVLWTREGYKDTTPRPSEIDPDILDNLGRAPFEIPCDEVVISAPQTCLANRFAADAMLGIWWSTLQPKRRDFNYTTFDIGVPHVSPFNRPALRDVSAPV